MKILYVNDDPVDGRLWKVLRDAGIDADIIIAKKDAHARELLGQMGDGIDIVLMDFDMGGGRDSSTVATGLVQAFVDAGFGKGKKMLVANSRSITSNEELMEAGCSHIFPPDDFAQFAVAIRH